MLRPSGLQLYQKETEIDVFSCEICETFRNAFLQNTFGGCFYDNRPGHIMKYSFHSILFIYFFSQILMMQSKTVEGEEFDAEDEPRA